MSEEVKEEIKQSTDGTLEQGEFKLKKKRGRPKKLSNENSETVKIDLTNKENPKTEENAVQESSPKEEVLQSNEEKEEQKVELQEVGQTHEEQKSTEETQQEEVVIEEVKSEENLTNEQVKNQEAALQENVIPESVHKLLDFMEDTGGSLEDFVRLNKDYTTVNESILLKEYYKNIKPYLEDQEIDFILEDQFSWDEDMDEEREIKKKKLAYKEEIAKAKNFLEETKKKYYSEIKLRPGTTQEQQKAMDFFNRYNKEQNVIQQQHKLFKDNTKKYFSNEFEGFNFNVGEKKFKYKINNISDTAENQSNLTNFVKKFLDEKGNVKDYNGYHKAIYTARNADNIANHFYEQGKADAIKDMMAKSKNINSEPRVSSGGDVYLNGLRVKAITGVDSSKLKIKTKK